jgi:hypothetical protein
MFNIRLLSVYPSVFMCDDSYDRGTHQLFKGTIRWKRVFGGIHSSCNFRN